MEIIGNNNCTKSNLPKKILIDGKLVSDKTKITDYLDGFFLNVGHKLAAEIPLSSATFHSYLIKNLTSEKIMKETHLDSNELRSALNTLKNNKSAGFDNISSFVVKLVFDIIEPSLHHIFDVSLKSGIVPDKLKIARVTTIFKSGDDFDTNNYRPISVLPCFS
ncbi:uncharacterized protein LOC136096856 [Hydra vulgaris]|uniref:uncharacterized protein LOC136096856 n=1 Tax=Hydra vulgaris TaxID=6087 RepID=UPI0032EA3EBB